MPLWMFCLSETCKLNWSIWSVSFSVTGQIFVVLPVRKRIQLWRFRLWKNKKYWFCFYALEGKNINCSLSFRYRHLVRHHIVLLKITRLNCIKSYMVFLGAFSSTRPHNKRHQWRIFCWFLLYLFSKVNRIHRRLLLSSQLGMVCSTINSYRMYNNVLTCRSLILPNYIDRWLFFSGVHVCLLLQVSIA